MKTSISSHYSDFQPSVKYKFFELVNAIHTTSKIPVTIWYLNIADFIQSNQNYTSENVKNSIQKMRINLNVLKRISHPGILRIYETSDEDSEPNVLSFSSERIKFCLDGSCCKNVCVKQYTNDESLFIASQISDALSYLHGQLSVANFGICPENIFITPNFDVKIGSLIYFAKFTDPLSVIEPNLYPSQTSIFDIDAHFLAPELKTHKNLTSKADVFMFGLTILYCYEGENFLNEMSSSDLSESQFLINYLKSENSNHTPGDMKLVLSKCFSEDPSERPTFQQLENSGPLSQLQIKALNFIDTIKSHPENNHKSFYSGLGGIIDQFSERILSLKIVPILVFDAATNYSDQSLLQDQILPMLLATSLKLPVNKIDSKILRKLFPRPLCQNFFLENCHKYLTSSGEITEIKDRIPFIGATIFNCFLSENTKEKGTFLTKSLFDKMADLSFDELKEIVLDPLFKSPDCATLLLFYIQTNDLDDDDDSDDAKSYQNTAVLIMSYSIEFINNNKTNEKYNRIAQKVKELIPKALEYGKVIDSSKFASLVIDPIVSNQAFFDELMNNLELIDDPNSLAAIASHLKESGNSSYTKIFPILLKKVDEMNLNDFTEKVYKPFFSDAGCALAMIENIEPIKKISAQASDAVVDEDSQLNLIQSIIINSYKHTEQNIKEKVPPAIPILIESLTPNQKANQEILRDKIFGPFYENFSSTSAIQVQCIIQIIKNSPKESPIIDVIVNLTYEKCCSNEQIMNEVSSLLPSYFANAKDIKNDVIKQLIQTDKYSAEIAASILDNISSIKDVDTKITILKHSLENATEDTDYEKLANLFVEVSNSNEFAQIYNNNAKFKEVKTDFVNPLFMNIESADFLIQNFEAFDHKYPTSKKIQVFIVNEISALVNNMVANGQDCSALSSKIPELLKECSPDVKENLESLQNEVDSIDYNQPIDYAFISTILESLNKHITKDLFNLTVQRLKSLYEKLLNDKSDENNRNLMINKISLVLANMPPYSKRTKNAVSFAFELVESEFVQNDKREKLLDFVEKIIAAIRKSNNLKPSQVGPTEDGNDDVDDDNDDVDESDKDDEDKNTLNENNAENIDPFQTPNAQVRNDPFAPSGDSNNVSIGSSEQPESGSSNPFNNAPSVTNNDPFSNQPANANPFSNQSNNADPFSTPQGNADPFSNQPSNANPFSNPQGNADPFSNQPSNANPFSNTQGNADPFSNQPSNNDPYDSDPAPGSNPFDTPETYNDNPFNNNSSLSNNNPFNTSYNQTANDPFSSPPANNDPFGSAPVNQSAPFNAAANNDPFATAPANNDPFNSNSTGAETSPPSSQSSNSKSDSKKEKKKDKDKKKKEHKEKRKSRTGLDDIKAAQSNIPSNSPANNPFSTSPNAVDPFKQMEASVNHFASPNSKNDPFASSPQSNANNDPFGSSAPTNNNPFFTSGAQPSGNSNLFAASNTNDPFSKPQNNDPFNATASEAKQKSEDNDDNDKEESSHSNKHHHHHHHHKQKHGGDNQAADGDLKPQKRESKPNASKRHLEASKSIPPTSTQNTNPFNTGIKRTPSFNIFENSKIQQQPSEFEANKASTDAKIDFNNDELDFDESD